METFGLSKVSRILLLGIMYVYVVDLLLSNILAS